MISSVLSFCLFIISVDIDQGCLLELLSFFSLLSPAVSGSGDGGHSVTEQ